MTFKVMTWNLENLFRQGTAFGPKTKAIYTEKLDGLAATIEQEAPDALAVQEVLHYRTALADRLPPALAVWNVAPRRTHRPSPTSSLGLCRQPTLGVQRIQTTAGHSGG